MRGIRSPKRIKLVSSVGVELEVAAECSITTTSVTKASLLLESYSSLSVLPTLGTFATRRRLLHPRTPHTA